MKTRVLVLMIWTSVWAFSSNSHAQQSTFSKVFKHTNGDIQGYSMVQSAESEYLIAGQMENMGVVLKTDSSGNFIWAKRYLLYGPLTRIIRTSDSLFVLLGMIGDQYDQLVCMKINGSGEVIWTKKLTFFETVQPNGIIETSDLGFLLTCESYVVKLDPTGNLLWITQPPAYEGLNTVHAAKQTPDGGFILFGKIMSSEYTSDASLQKINSDGTVLWLKKLVIQGPAAITQNFDIVITNSGFYCYYYQELNSNSRILLIKTDLYGNVLWGKKVLSYINSPDYFQAPTLQQTTDHGLAFVIPGEWGEIIRTDSTGNILWSNFVRLNTTDLIKTYDLGFLALGMGPLNKLDNRLSSPWHIGIIKLDSLGNAPLCVEMSGTLCDTIQISSTPVPVFTNPETAEISNMAVSIINDELWNYDGCVDVISNIQENGPVQEPVYLYPNPSGNIISVDLSASLTLPLTMVIHNSVGVLIDQILLNNHANTIDISDWSAGFYSYRLTGKSFQFNGKFIKR